MVSDSLTRLRESVKKQAALYQRFRQKTVPLHQDKGLDTEWKYHMLREHIAKAQQERADLLASLAAEREQVLQRAQRSDVQSTPEARAKVERALSNGFTLHDLAGQLVSEGDRASMQALVEYLPYAARAGQLGYGNEPAWKQVEHARQSLRPYESQMWTEAERRAQDDLREVEISWGMVQQNDKRLDVYLGRQLLSRADQERIDSLLGWQGTPETPVQAGMVDPNVTLQEV